MGRTYHARERMTGATICGAPGTAFDTHAEWVREELRTEGEWTEPGSGKLCDACLSAIARTSGGDPP
jgi:hypothetical protein